MRRDLVLVFSLFAVLPAVRPGDAAAAAASDSRSVRTVFLPSPGNPLCAIRIYFQLGSVDDPKGKEGLAALTSEIVGRGGTKSRTYAEVLDALYPLGTRIGVYGDKESVVFAVTVHRDNLVSVADLMAEQILAPRFAEDDFERNRRNAVDLVSKTLRGNDDENLGKQGMATLLYAGHPYGSPTQGTVAGLAAVTPEDVKNLYGTHFSRDRLIVGVAGGYPDGFAESFARRFEALPATSPPMPVLPAPTSYEENQVLVVEKEARADAISAGHAIDVDRNDPDFYALTVARSYLGEHRAFTGALMKRLRVDRGLNYGDFAYIENFIQDGESKFPLPNIARRQQHFELWLRPVPPQNALFALRAAVYETDKLIREGIPQAGFDSTKKFLMGYSNLWAQDVSRRLGFAIDAIVTGKDVIKELQARLPRIRKADVDNAIRKHLRTRGLTIAIVARNAQEIAEKLATGVPTPITYDTTGTASDVLALDKVIEKFPLPVSKANIRIIPVDQMFESASMAAGASEGRNASHSGAR